MPGFFKERITILFQKYETRVPDCHRCSKAVTNLIPPADEKIIQIKNYRNLKISPILKAPKVAQRTKVVLISQNYTLGLNGPQLCPVAACGLRRCPKVQCFCGVRCFMLLLHRLLGIAAVMVRFLLYRYGINLYLSTNCS